MIKIGIILSLLAFANCVDYCKICSKHIACKNTGLIASKCRSDSVIIDLNKTGIKDIFIKNINEKRNQVALGKLDNFEPAVRMATIQWDDELAKLADLNAKTCEYGTDECHSTERFEYSGQTLNSIWTSGTFDVIVSTKETIDGWFDQYKNANMEIVDSYHYVNPDVSQFMTLIAEKNTRFGCAILQIKDSDGMKLNTVCNFAVTPADDSPIYEKGPTASNCKTGKNPNYPGLCAIEEEKSIDVNEVV